MDAKINRLLVVGGSGMVGSRFVELSSSKFQITSVDEKTLDITDKNAVMKFFKKTNFDTVINFSAYTNVDGAENPLFVEIARIWNLNVKGALNLAEACKKNGTFYVHISTDFVFNGKDGPYDEDHFLPTDQEEVGYYAWTKINAEFFVKEVNEINTAIVRYSFPFRATDYPLKEDWARKIIVGYEENKLHPFFTDQTTSILFLDDLVAPLSKIIENKMSGIFHIASKNTGTPYEFASYLLEKYTGHDVKIQKSSILDYLKTPGIAKRPIRGGLKVEKTEEKLGIKMRTWQEMINDFVSVSRYLQTAY